jgi:hypothetical protein
MEKHEAQWCRRFVEVMMACGATNINAAVRLAIATYPSASSLSAEQTVWLLAQVEADHPTRTPDQKST